MAFVTDTNLKNVLNGVLSQIDLNEELNEQEFLLSQIIQALNLQGGTITPPISDSTDAIFGAEINDTVRKVLSHKANGGVSFAWISDTHTYLSDDTSVNQYNKCLSNIEEVNKRVNLDFAVHTGDFINTQWLWHNNAITSEQYGQYVKEYASKFCNNISCDSFIAVGNHDGGYVGNNVENSSYSAYNQNIMGLVSNNSKTVIDGTNPWYYVDYPSHKLRCLYICTNYNSTANEVKGIHYDECKWIKNVFDSMQKDWNIMIFGHIPFTRFWSKLTQQRDVFVNMLNAINNHGQYNISSYVGIDATTYTGKILAYFCGHSHGDEVLLPSDSKAHFTFPEVSIAGGGYISSELISGDYSDGVSTYERTYGTVSQDAWDVVTYNRTDNKIYITRFGAGSDREIIL